MTRVRLLLLAVALGLAIPVGLLVHRALASAETEERAGRQALADTAFAAVERELAGLLSREEGRAWDEWRHLRVPEGEVRGSEGLVRSPLAELSREPWIFGWFQVEPDGTVGSPLVPQDELASTLLLGAPSPAARARDAEIRARVAAWLAARPARPLRPAPRPQAEPVRDPGRYRSDRLSSSRGDTPASEFALPSASAADEVLMEESRAPSIRDAEQREVKKGVSTPSRQERATLGKAEVFQKQGYSDVVQQMAMRNSGVMKDQDEAPASGRRDAKPDGLTAGSAAAAPQEATESEEPIVAAARKDVEVEVEAFTGELAGADRLVLQRLVVVAGVPYRQGLLIDVHELAARVDPLELLARTAGLDGTFALGTEATSAGAFSRRLPAPFDPLLASLTLAGPDAHAGVRAVLALAALLAVVGALGLLAIDRMVGTSLAYAQRRSDFVSAVTHELKTPLAAIRLHGEMLQEGIAASEEKRASSYRTITTECERLTRLVDNVLELSRLEKGTRSVHLVTGPIEPVLSEALSLLEPHASSVGFALELEVESGLTARFDRDALLQVVFNLVDNGLKYAREAEDKRIALVARRDGDAVALLVRDHGPGVPQRHLRRIFEPFWRGERELTRRAKGTGIGLALVRGLVERMQGRVSGRNAAGGGFEIRVTLPGAAP